MNDSLPHGFAFPFSIDPASGQVVTSTGDRSIRDNMMLLVQTEIGERPLNRNSGSGLRAFLHEPMNDAFLHMVKHQVGRAITEGEPRVQIADLSVQSFPRGATMDGSPCLEIEVIYTIRRTQQLDRFKLSLPMAV